MNDWHVASSDACLLAALQMRCNYCRNRVIDDFSLRRAAFHLPKAEKRLMSKPTCETDGVGGNRTPRRFALSSQNRTTCKHRQVFSQHIGRTSATQIGNK